MSDDDDLSGPPPLDPPGDDDVVPGSAVDGKARERQTQRLGKEFQERVDFWKSVLATEVGRRELWRTIFGSNAAHVAEQRFGSSPNGSPDPESSWYQRGQKDLGDQILAELESVDREGVWLMRDAYDPRFPKRPQTAKRGR